MRVQLAVWALVVFLTGSAVGLAATRAGTRARPDLVVSSLSNPPSVVFLGKTFQVTDRTRNIGTATAGATTTRYYLTANAQQTVVARRSVARLKSHRSSTGSATATVPATLKGGTYSLVACADAAHVANEANERNNCKTATTKVIVKKPPPPV